MSNAIYCHRCGTRLPDSAAYCPACGSAVWQPQQTTSAPNAQHISSPMRWAEITRKAAPYILGLVVLALVIAAYIWHRSKAAATAAADAAAAKSYNQLTDRLSQLSTAQTSLDGLRLRINDDGRKLESDMSDASSTSQRRHDASSISVQTDLAQIELTDVKDAENVESSFESQVAQYIAVMQSVYGADATHQLRDDIASGNEAMENAISSWMRAIDEISDNLKAAGNFQTAPYSNSEVVSFYTASSTADSNAAKFRRLSFADAQSLVTRLKSDIARTRARLSQLEAQHPELARQTRSL
jgi:zinc-ribbon domain